MTVVERAKQEITPIIEQNGYEVVEISYEKKYGTYDLTFFIYKKGGITLQDCETVNNLLEVPLEEKDITNGEAFNLNISSSGLDRAIESADDFRRNKGEVIELLLKEPQAKKERIFGELVSYDDTSVTILLKEKEKSFGRDKLKKIQLYVKF